MRRKNQEKKVKELKKGDCHKKRGGSGKTIQEQMLEITGKNGNAQ